MGQVNCRKHYLSLRKSLVLYIIAFVVLAVFLSVTTFSICGSAAEGIRASYPPSGEKYYLTNEQGEQLGDGAYIGTVPVPMSKEDERTIALLEKLPIVAKQAWWLAGDDAPPTPSVRKSRYFTPTARFSL